MDEVRERIGRSGFAAPAPAPALELSGRSSENVILRPPESSSAVIFVSGVRLLMKRLAEECLENDGLIGGGGGAAAVVEDGVSVLLVSLDSVTVLRNGVLPIVRREGSVGVGAGRLLVSGNAVPEPIEPYPGRFIPEGCLE